MNRRAVLQGGAAATALGLTSHGVSADAGELAAAVARFRASIPANFDRTYVESAVIPSHQTCTVGCMVTRSWPFSIS
jgi:hypothetical protein